MMVVDYIILKYPVQARHSDTVIPATCETEVVGLQYRAGPDKRERPYLKKKILCILCCIPFAILVALVLVFTTKTIFDSVFPE
jgi:hypothetical protein